MTIHAQTGLVDSDDFYQRNVRRPRLPDYTQKIEDLLKRMTLEEKVGQMTQLAIGMIINGQDQNFQIDPAKLEKAIVKYGVGSILNVSDQALTIDRWHEVINDIQAAAKRTRLGIPMIYGIDSIHGALSRNWNSAPSRSNANHRGIDSRKSTNTTPVANLRIVASWPLFMPNMMISAPARGR